MLLQLRYLYLIDIIDGRVYLFVFLYLRFSSIADQTPTPTRFLKNCEEVGLFNELTSPFDHDFKKATEDDFKKVFLVVLLLVILSSR